MLHYIWRWLSLTCLLATLTSVCSDPNFITLNDQAWVVTNQVDGIYEGDFFHLFSFNYRYMSVYINQRRLKQIRKNEKETSDWVELFMMQKKKEKVYLSRYSFPTLTSGNHEMTIYLSGEMTSDGTSPFASIRSTIHCTPVDLMFFAGETCVCRLVDHPQIIRGKNHGNKNKSQSLMRLEKSILINR